MPFVKSPVLTPRKLAANRSNARHSTGPRTYRGKCRVALNALRHGRFASSKLFRTHLVRNHDDVALYDWVYAQACLAFRPVEKRAWSDAARVALEVWCLVREGSRRDVQQGRQKVSPEQAPEGGQAGCLDGGQTGGSEVGQTGERGGQRGWQRPGRASLWCHFRIPTRLNGGYGTKPRYAVKSLDTRVTSRIRFTVNGPFEGFRTNLRLKFWVRAPRRLRPRLEWPPHLDPREFWPMNPETDSPPRLQTSSTRHNILDSGENSWT